VKDNPAYVHFLDISGDDIYVEIRIMSYTKATGFVLVVDVEPKESFDQLQNLIEEGKHLKANFDNYIFIGNKCDKTQKG
jgi:GTPase SAR1 family protein